MDVYFIYDWTVDTALLHLQPSRGCVVSVSDHVLPPPSLFLLPTDGATPSASRRHHTGLREPPAAAAAAAAAGDPALTKSRSHESQLTGRLEGDTATQSRYGGGGGGSVRTGFDDPR